MSKSFIYFFRVVAARAYVRVIGAQRELSWLIGDTVLPFLSVAAYIYVYRAMKAPPEYTGFVILGGILMTFWVHMLWNMGMQLFWEKEVGNLGIYLMAPLPRPALLLGMAVGGMIMTSTRALIIYLASRLFFDINFSMDDPLLALMVFLATMTALYGMGMTLSSLFFIAGRGVNHCLQLLHEPVFFLGGFYFPVRQLGTVVASIVAGLIPVTLGLDALRQTMFGAYSTGLLPPYTELMILIVMSVIFILLSLVAVRKLENMGRRDGSLTLHQQ
ncbi:MAG: ABC transporter permease [Candidatus Electryoneaceae bacterium]|nr:ABC transporter permease [Candidatus Electryoneaceae bacterium]